MIRVLAAGLLAAILLPGAAAAERGQGWSFDPAVKWVLGDHAIDMNAEVRYRWEYWKAFTDEDTNISGFRGRASLGYSWREYLRVWVQAQLVSVLGMESGATGAAGVYRASAGKSDEWSLNARQFYAEGRYGPLLFARLGRQDINVGTLVRYDEGNWNYLKVKRLSQRLIGTVGWTNVERSFDAVTARVEPLPGNDLFLWAARPTTGVFELADPYEANTDIITGGFDWTVKRGTLFENVELTGFFLAFHDTRNPAKVAGLFGDIKLYTLGGSALGVHSLGAGRLDWILWGAFQAGSYVDDPDSTGAREFDQIAGAAIAEVGYQLHQVWSAPWLRLGVNWASGDGNPSGGDRNTFFNVLPTNHLYYGYADQLAFSNLVDLLVQLKLAPLPKLGIEAVFHQFWLASDSDRRWVGTGAFSKSNLGYISSASNGSNNVGQEIDLVVSWKPHRTTTLSGGFAKLFGGNVFRGAQHRDTDWAFIQLRVAY